MSKMKVFGHGDITLARELDPLTNQEREHAFVSTESGKSWGCMGRNLEGIPNPRVLCEGFAEVEWMEAIAEPGPDYAAGITNKVTGVCHQCANRILLPAGITVDQALGNEVAVMAFGLYGPDIQDVVALLKNAAFKANQRLPGCVTDEDMECVINKITHNGLDEYEIMRTDFENKIGVKLTALPAATLGEVQSIYLAYVDRRTSIYRVYRQSGDKDCYLAGLRESLQRTLEAYRELIGHEKYNKLFRFTPEYIVANFIH